ncbi:hypothetical protein [Jannaschia ovalis]|uniref:TFIIB zinc-binding n=1 Tax=Jannaschia ovalis TaxID=3038773 RepID=A0ABY8LC20_9RHOB|nr:hypothetical protein [Jannaschia sp. GRR-S6-38]WGH77943.1 hypothetical protein P8627_13005 [Jannaschia sp. GRR-S6-38]
MAEPKIATCCYCSRRTVLRNTAHGGHELACGSCGAPLHVMKPLKTPRPRPVVNTAPARPRKAKKKKPKRPLWQKIAAEIWDEVEDIFD